MNSLFFIKCFLSGFQGSCFFCGGFFLGCFGGLVDLHCPALFVDFFAFCFGILRRDTVAVVNLSLIICPFERAFSNCGARDQQCGKKNKIVEILHVWRLSLCHTLYSKPVIFSIYNVFAQVGSRGERSGSNHPVYRVPGG